MKKGKVFFKILISILAIILLLAISVVIYVSIKLSNINHENIDESDLEVNDNLNDDEKAN